MCCQPYLVRTHNVQGQPKTGDKLLEIVRDDIQHIKDEYEVTIIAWCTDDGPDGKKMRRLLKLLFLWIIVIVCWAHQINLVVGDFLRLKLPFLKSVSQSLEVVKWFNNHGAALALLQTEQKLTYEGKTFALLLPAITHWTAHFLSVSRTLKVKNALKTCCVRHEEKLLVCAGRDAESHAKAESVLEIVKDDQFWVNLVK